MPTRISKQSPTTNGIAVPASLLLAVNQDGTGVSVYSDTLGHCKQSVTVATLIFISGAPLINKWQNVSQRWRGRRGISLRPELAERDGCLHHGPSTVEAIVTIRGQSP